MRLGRNAAIPRPVTAVVAGGVGWTLRVRGLERVQLHADVCILRGSPARLRKARAVPPAA